MSQSPGGTLLYSVVLIKGSIVYFKSTVTPLDFEPDTSSMNKSIPRSLGRCFWWDATMYTVLYCRGLKQRWRSSSLATGNSLHLQLSEALQDKHVCNCFLFHILLNIITIWPRWVGEGNSIAGLTEAHKKKVLNFAFGQSHLYSHLVSSNECVTTRKLIPFAIMFHL